MYPNLNNLLDFEIYFIHDAVFTNHNWTNYRATLLTVLFIKARKSLLLISYDSSFVLKWSKSCLYHFNEISNKWRLRRTWLPHSDMGACLNENGLWYSNYATSVVGAHSNLNPILFTRSKHWSGNKIIHKITKFFLEFFQDRMQECILTYFVCNTVNTMNNVQPNNPRGIQASVAAPRLTFYRCICYILHLIYIFNEAVMSYKGSEIRLCFSMSLDWCLIPNQFHQINICCESLNSPTLFLK